MLSRALLLALVVPLAAAEDVADPLALWAFGDGTRGGQPVLAGAVVVAGESLTSGERPVRLELLGLPGSDVILRPGSAIHLTRDPQHRDRLVVELRAGAVEIDLRGAGADNEIEVHGAALSVRGHDCLFLIERDGADADYVAVISGQAMAGLRPGMTIDDGGMAIMLQARQGLRCSSANGLAEVDQLDERPQLLASLPLQDQGEETGDDDSWSDDDAAVATEDPPADGGVTSLPPVAVAPTAPPAPESRQPVADQPPVAATEPKATPPAPAPQEPVGSHSQAGPALIDALAEDASPGWQRRGRSVFPSPH